MSSYPPPQQPSISTFNPDNFTSISTNYPKLEVLSYANSSVRNLPTTATTIPLYYDTNTNEVKTSSNSSVLNPVRNLATNTTTLPLYYDTSSKEVKTNSTAYIQITSGNTADASYYNSFIVVGSSASGSVNLPTPVVTFPATITIQNNSSNSQNLTTSIGNIIVNTANTATNSFTSLAGTIVQLITDGTNWIVTNTYSNISANSFNLSYTTLPTLTNTQIGFNTTSSVTTSTLTASIANYGSIILPTIGVYLITFSINYQVNPTTTAGYITTNLSLTSASATSITGGLSYSSTPITTTTLYSSSSVTTYYAKNTTGNTTIYLNCSAVNFSALPAIYTGSIIQFTRIA